jgi:natural product biosynthesis luciferase-like monooxygenase protein
MNTSFPCVLIGRGPQLVACADHLLRAGHRVVRVISDCGIAAGWAQRNGVPRSSADEDLVAVLRAEPFDWLFSIVNHAITAPELLALPRLGAVNYHDSLLPAYGGFHATAWAILDGQREHGITWHRMTAAVDAGPYLVQKTFPISEQDTAFSLAAQAGELATRAFAELLASLALGTAREQPPQPLRQFHRKSERPGCAVLDWSQPAVSALRTVRATDFGSEDNWFGRAKLRAPNGDFVLVGSAVPSADEIGRPGVVLRVVGTTVVVKWADAALACSELCSIDGAPLGGAELAAHGFLAGAALPPLDAEFVRAAAALDAQVTGNERFWVRRLQRLAVPQFHELRGNVPAGPLQQLAVPLPPAVSAAPPADREAMVLAALAAYTARVGDDVQRVDLPLVAAPVSGELARLYAPVVPASFAIDLQAPWRQLVAAARQELAATAARGTYARDVWSRYESLRKSSVEREPRFAVAFGMVAGEPLPAGVRLRFALAPGARELVLQFDGAALGKLHAQRLGDRITGLLAAAAAAPETAIGGLDIVPAAERALLLQEFQDTARPGIDTSCIHEAFAAQVARTPDRTALVFRDASLSYRQLDDRAEALARHLRGLGVGPDRLVAIAIERSLDMVIGLLAILKAGGAYVPLDPAYPPERLAMMLEDSGARWLLTQRHLRSQLPPHDATVVLVDDVRADAPAVPAEVVRPEHLAYVIFTSGSTGRPKGVMVEHRNVANFFAGMDERIGREPGTWLAVTSISFDISVLEIFWTLARGFETVIQEEGDRASLLKAQSSTATVASSRPMGFGLFYFSADSTDAAKKNAYRLLLDGARFADTHDFVAVWTPERHFHAFGGLYPNAAVTSAAIASITNRVQLRAGSVVIPLHDPIRVAEDWAVVDNLSGGRVGLSFASGWHANDFVLQPDNYERRREVMFESIHTVLRLWAGEKIKRRNGQGQEIEVAVLPRPVRERPPMWIASAGNVETFRNAGTAGWNVLTNMLGQDIKDLGTKFAAYREARRAAGHPGEGIISVMLHTFVTDSDERARQVARGPFGNYLTTSYDLVKVAPWMFPAFKQPSVAGGGSAFDPDRFDAADMEALLDHAFDRYFDTAGLFGTPQRALRLIEQLKDIGATEVACLVDFGIDPEVVLANLVHLDELRRLANPGSAGTAAGLPAAPVSIREQFERRRITHFQSTPSMARILMADGTLGTMGSLRKFLVGGEALTAELAESIHAALPQVELLNMYGPTETTVWSTSAAIARGPGTPITIGVPIANTQIRILDARLGLLPLGVPGELCIGGAGVVRGYLHRPELTAERFVVDPWMAGNRLYRTGDLARWREDGTIEYLGRLDQQVKVNGYRIELGEIETVLRRHPAVQQAVVAAKTWNGSTQLVGYVIPAGGAAQPGAAAESATAWWQSRWDTAYANRVGAADAPARRDTSGWLSSFTGEPIAAPAMHEWLDQTVARILALRPERVLEIGCGTGMILFGCLEHVRHYTAIDQSPVALAAIRRELTSAEQGKVDLRELAAHQLSAVPDRSCDVVVINSVAQYFPDVDYLVQVLMQCARVLVDGGSVFLGDVRCLELAGAFHTAVELHQAPSLTPASELAARITERESMDPELLLARGFFGTLSQRVTRLQTVSIQGKRGRHATEMRDFRCDVVLRAGAPLPELDLSSSPQVIQPQSLQPVLDVLRDSPPLLRIRGARNARLDRLDVASARIRAAEAGADAESLLAVLQQPAQGVDPDALFDLHPDYDVELRCSDDPARFDALLRHRRHAPIGVWAAPATGSGATASTPYVRRDDEAMVPKLRAHVRAFLPEYMVPTAFAVLGEFPLTPNGKIDRKALPNPVEQARVATAEQAPPANALERTIAAIWQQMLGIERVGRKDNIFDLGASSLLTVEANSRLQQELGHKIPLVTMFRYPTIESLAAHLAKSIGAVAGDAGAAAGSGADAESERQSRLAAAAERRRQARARNG